MKANEATGQDYVVDSITLTCEADSFQGVSIYWSRSSRPFSRHRLPFNMSSPVSSFYLDRSSSQFCENCEVFVRSLFPFDLAVPSRHHSLKPPSPLHSDDDCPQYVFFGCLMELPFLFIPTTPSNSVSHSMTRFSSFQRLRWNLQFRWMRWVRWIQWMRWIQWIQWVRWIQWTQWIHSMD